MKHKFKVTNNKFGTNPMVFHHMGRPSLGRGMQNCDPPEYNRYHFKRLVMESCCYDEEIFRARMEGKKIKDWTPPPERLALGLGHPEVWPCLNGHYPAPTPSHIANNPLNQYLHLFTVNNTEEPGSGVRQMRHFGMETKVLGKHIKEGEYDHDAKIPLLIKHIPTITEKYTMFFDSDDVWFSEDPRRLVKNFEKVKQCKMLCNGDGYFFPKDGLGEQGASWYIERDEEDLSNKETESNPSPYRFLNSGVWIARTDFLQEEFLPRLKILRAAWELDMSIKTYSDCDQAMFHYIYKDLYPDMRIDNTCEFFQPWMWGRWFEENYKDFNSLTIEKE